MTARNRLGVFRGAPGPTAIRLSSSQVFWGKDRLTGWDQMATT